MMEFTRATTSMLKRLQERADACTYTMTADQHCVVNTDDLMQILRLVKELKEGNISLLEDKKRTDRSNQRLKHTLANLHNRTNEVVGGMCVHPLGIVMDDGGSPVCPKTWTRDASDYRPTSRLDAVGDRKVVNITCAWKYQGFLADSGPSNDASMAAVVDAVMSETASLYPPLRRRDCERLILAVLRAIAKDYHG